MWHCRLCGCRGSGWRSHFRQNQNFCGFCVLRHVLYLVMFFFCQCDSFRGLSDCVFRVNGESLRTWYVQLLTLHAWGCEVSFHYIFWSFKFVTDGGFELSHCIRPDFFWGSGESGWGSVCIKAPAPDTLSAICQFSLPRAMASAVLLYDRYLRRNWVCIRREFSKKEQITHFLIRDEKT